MRLALRLVLAGAFAFGSSPVFAQELVEMFCDDNDPQTMCSDDNLSVVFDDTGNNVFEYDTFTDGTRIPVTIMMDTKSDNVQGWSYGLRSDDQFVVVTDDDISLDGTDAREKIDMGSGFGQFLSNKAVTGGLISAIVMDFGGQSILDVKMNSLLKVNYTQVGDPGTDGTLLQFVSEEIGVEGSPVTEINVTNGGDSLAPRLLTHGQIKQAGEEPCVPTEPDAEVTCDDGLDNDCDGLIDDADPDCEVVVPGGCPEGTPANALYFGAVGGDFTADGNTVALVSRNDADLLGFSLGVNTDGQWTFSPDIGNNDQAGNPVLPGLNFTAADGSAVEPAIGNAATVTSMDPITSVARGSAIAAFAEDPDDSDFFAVDLNPDLGGPGFMVGYVASLGGDIEKVIPTTPSPADMCPSNELIVVTLGGGTPFNRGDSNGDDRITVTDGVLIIQNVAGNIPENFPNCPAINDANGDGTNDLADGVYLLNYVFKKASPLPPAPFRTCEIGPGDCAESNCAG